MAKTKFHYHDSWLLQNLAIFGAFLSLVAIFILLGKSDNKPIFHWNGLSINVLVAIFAALLKALLAFSLSDCLGQAKWIWFSKQQRPLRDLYLIDGASRGPLGSLKLLGYPVARSFITFGAVAVIISIAIDPFAQLTIGKKETVVLRDDNATQIAFAKRYSKGSLSTFSAAMIADPNGNNYSATSTDADFAMKSAVLYGASQSFKLVEQQAKRTCVTGNCTFPVFFSLAVCSHCVDQRDRLERVTPPDGSPLYQELGMASNGASSLGPLTEFRLPNGLRLNNQNDVPSTTYMTAYGSGNPAESIAFKDRDTLIWSMTSILVNDSEAKWPNSAINALECGLWYCVNRYLSEVDNGTLFENGTSVPFKRSPDSWQVSAKQPQGVQLAHPPSDDSLLYNASSSASVARTDLQLTFDIPDVGHPDLTGYNLSQAAIYGISDFMNTTFTTKGGPKSINSWVVSEPDLTYSPTAMQVLYSSKDLQSTFKTLAWSMSNSIRQNSDDNNFVSGMSGTYETHVRAHWYYFILPAVLVLAGAIFQAIVMIYTRKTKTEIWCSNVLPAVALGRKVGTVFDDAPLLSQMEKRSKLQRLELSRSDHGNVPMEDTGHHDAAHYEMMPRNSPPTKQGRVSDVVSALSDEDMTPRDGAQSNARLV
ncbi:uncharacterized protein KY384_008905 [Bacidia gigantensis]|uniref:uncharacterized protein n=1 Tax=Bacidia gigantensis TaxID=2732470 RepID=UPI001D053686|nr:uncharacterized protein KY384_008905 [Bacidia gigantensis]KAG8525261.1 hypothetical protein KY384_008905 [Bacidia gigantensis]